MTRKPTSRTSHPAESEAGEWRMRRLDARYCALIQAVTPLVLIVDARGANGADAETWQAFTGQIEARVAGMGWLDAVHPEDREGVAQLLRRAMASRGGFETSYRLRRHDGAYRWFEVRGVPILDETGHRDEWMLVSRDVEDERSLIERLQESERRLAAAQAIAHVGSWDWNLVTNQLTWSDELHRIYGYDPRESVATHGTFFQDLLHPEDRAQVEAFIRTIQAASEPGKLERTGELEFRIVRPDGAVRWLHATIVVTFDEAGRAIRDQGTAQDITERKWADLEVRRSSERLKILSETSRYFAESATDYPRLLENIARRVAEVMGGAISIYLISEDTRQIENVVTYHVDSRVREYYQQYIASHPLAVSRGLGGQAMRSGRSLHLPMSDPEVQRVLRISDYQALVDDLNVTGVLIVPLKVRGESIGVLYSLDLDDSGASRTEEDLRLFEDLADRAALAIDSARLIETLEQRVRERTTDLETAYESLKELDRLKSNFVNSVTHELRTPLTSIIGYAEFMQDEIGGGVTPMQREFVSQIERGARRLEYLLNDLLDFARLEAGTFTLKLEVASFAAKVREVVESFKPQVDEARLSLEVSLADELLTLRMDPQRIGQVLINLLGNAIKFTPPGGRIQVRARIDRERLICEIEDSGPGIASEDLPKLFQRFRQLEAGVTMGKGTGLGLSISKALVEAHGGTIAVRSEPGRGSTFWFALPLNPEAEEIHRCDLTEDCREGPNALNEPSSLTRERGRSKY